MTSCRNYLDVPPYPLRGTEREFLRAVGYCHLWISGLAEIAKPLYSSTRGMHPLNWTEVEQQAFEKLKRALVSAPALALPDVTKPFHLYVSETPSYTKQEEKLAEQKQAIKGPDGWWILPDDRLLVPEALGRTTPTAIKVDGVQTWLHHSQLLHQETAWILATTREIPSLGSTKARRKLNTCRRRTGIHCGQYFCGL
ncbi:hypothetical protein QTO34_000692 [Cnephaeus nilssonii]|uniref:Reverse transcriptase/retrotransposon-derived protein RNase H-like domain-containing protein n=1 Tax=Cnephaeus nilssonii TaxID=3371016 RepID=A0AA40LX67_CNENI|nr:hypothetical protein QTO34_000692 [Eptesicus nilssonii]